MILGSHYVPLGPRRAEDYLVLWSFSHSDVDDGKIKQGVSGFAETKLECHHTLNDCQSST